MQKHLKEWIVKLVVYGLLILSKDYATLVVQAEISTLLVSNRSKILLQTWEILVILTGISMKKFDWIFLTVIFALTLMSIYDFLYWDKVRSYLIAGSVLGLVIREIIR